MATLCPHGLTTGECLICATLTTAPADAGRARVRRRPASGPVRRRGSGAGLVLAVIAVLVVAWWLIALVSLIVRLAGLVAISAGSGWVGWRLGVRHGRRSAD
ncbi:MAG: hypothetical protein V7605_1330 [Acidimicrobiaceae bacterium]|jgi:hypothetical protein